MNRFKVLFNIALIFFGIHLTSTHSKLIYNINPDGYTYADTIINVDTAGNKELIISQIKPKFRFSEIKSHNPQQEDLILSIIWALSFSFITISLIKIIEVQTTHFFMYMLPFIYFAVLDGFGILLYYNTPLESQLFFSLLT